MAQTYTYTFLAKDLMTGPLAKMGKQGRVTFTEVGKEADGATGKIQRTNRASKGLGVTWGGLTRMAARLGIAFSVGSAIKGIFTLGQEAENTRVGFETMLGSAEKADTLISKINKFANATPYNNRDLQKNTELLLGFEVAQEKVLPVLSMLGDVSRGNKARFGQMTLAFAQMSSTGRLMGQDLNQMINAGFNPLQYIADATGESMAQVKKRMEQGAVSALEVENAFARATGKGGPFYKMMEKMSKTFAGRWSTFTGKLQQFGMEFGEKLLPKLIPFIDWGIRMIDILPAVVSSVGDLFRWVQDSWIFQTLSDNVWLVVGGLVAWKVASFTLAAGLKIQSLWTTLLTVKQWSLNAAMAANPVGLILLGIVALAAAFTYAYNRIGWFRGGVDGAWVGLKGLATGIKDYVLTRIQELLKGITGMGGALMAFFKGDWKKAWEMGKKAADDLNPFTGDAQKNFKGQMKFTAYQWKKAVREGAAEAEKNKKEGSFFDMIKKKGSGLLGGTTDGATGDPSGSGDLSGSLTNGINAINGGGSRQTHITVTFEKLVETFAINSQNIQQGFAQSEEELKRMLLRVLNSANQLQTAPV